MHNLGFAYFRGEGVAVNFDEAGRWLRAAAESGRVESQFAFGNFNIDPKVVQPGKPPAKKLR